MFVCPAYPYMRGIILEDTHEAPFSVSFHEYIDSALGICKTRVTCLVSPHVVFLVILER